ncbi:hypothetical protein pb186bvf_013706 [Paramecium bursaria]
MNLTDSFFDDIEITMQTSQTFRKPTTICKSLEKQFEACNDAKTIKKQSIDIPRKATYISLQNEKPKSTSRGNSYHMVKPDNYLSKQLNKNSKSFLHLKSQHSTTNNQNKSFLKQPLQINLDDYNTNIRQKTQSSHQTSYRLSLVHLLKQRTKSRNKQETYDLKENSISQVCKTQVDESRQRVPSTHRAGGVMNVPKENNTQNKNLSFYQQKIKEFNDKQMEKSNSSYIQEFRKMFQKHKN